MGRGAGPVVRDAKKARTRQLLIEHAVALFDEFGFEETTVDEIVAAAGCSQRTFFRHFTCKEDVVFDDLPAQLARFTELLNAVPSTTSSWTAIRDTLRSLTRQFTEQDPELTAVRIRLWMTEPLLYARWTEISMDWERIVTLFLTDRRRHQHSDFDMDAEVVAAAVIAVLRAAWRGEVLHGGKFDDLVAGALELLERGLARI